MVLLKWSIPMDQLEEIYQLIKQGNSYLESPHTDLVESYFSDAWIGIKQYLKEQKLQDYHEIDEDGTLSNFINNQCSILFSLGYYEQAIDFANDALATLQLNQDERLDFKKHIADAHYFLDDHKQAIHLYQEYLRQYPNHPSLLYGLALLYFRLKEYPLAIQHFKQVASLEDTFFKDAAIEMLIECYQEVNDYEKQQELISMKH